MKRSSFVRWLVFICCIAVFGLLAWDMARGGWVTLVDQRIATDLHDWATEPVTRFFYIATLFGSEILTLLALVMAVYFIWRREWGWLAALLLARVGGGWLNYVLKALFERPRPIFDDPLATATFYSFPSGHAMGSMIVYGLLAYWLLRRYPQRGVRLTVIGVTSLLILLIGFSRLYLGVHYFSDVVAGFAAGIVWLALCIAVFHLITVRLAAPEPSS